MMSVIRSKIYIITILLTIQFVLIFSKAYSFDRNLKIVNVWPSPNYPLCTDANDVRQLSDGTVLRYPIWLRKRCVGWKQQRPVCILVEPFGNENGQTLCGKFLFHTANGRYANVRVPARIDIYVEDKNGMFFHSGGKTICNDCLEDRKTHWIKVEAKCVLGRVLLIVWPNGDYLFLDEVRWEGKTGICKRPGDNKIAFSRCAIDSLKRYRNSLLKSTNIAEKTVNDLVLLFGSNRIKTWVVPSPYEKLESGVDAASISKAKDKVSVTGTMDEIECACVGVLSTFHEKVDVSVLKNGDEELLKRTEIALLGKVLAGNGSIVFDPIIPMREKVKLSLSPCEINYLWISVDMRNMKPGVHRMKILLYDSQNVTVSAIPIQVIVIGKKIPRKCWPYAIAWGYTDDKPIWKTPHRCVSDLVNHGVNVFVVHTSNIPPLSKNKSWDVERAERLRQIIQLYKHKGIILLYLGYDSLKKKWVLNFTKDNSFQFDQMVRKWLSRLAHLFSEEGVGKKEWALYPIDEPTGQDFLYLRYFASLVKHIDPDVQIYADPITTSDSKTRVRDLRPLLGLIDFWQPSLRLINGLEYDLFQRLRGPWWIYQNPPVPAKAASPLRYYRLLAWKAWSLGADGLGFWSYSDTSHTSAWDDFDGRRPDWAVVYESSDGPISSRRWEAFREGIEDFALLTFASEINARDAKLFLKNLKRRIREGEVDSQSLEATRTELIQFLKYQE